MGLVKEITPKGLKVFRSERHIKTMPSKFEPVLREKHIINPLRKRLTKEERFKLEVSLFESVLKQEKPLVYEYIKRSVPQNVQLVHKADGTICYWLGYRKGTVVVCPKSIFDVGYAVLPPLNPPSPQPIFQTAIS